jgi:hypothetical protein
MSFSELAVAFGLLAPLILGIIGLIDKRIPVKNKPPEEKKEQVVMGTPVSHDYAGELIAELRQDIKDLKEQRKQEAIRADKAEAERDAYKKIVEGK